MLAAATQDGQLQNEIGSNAPQSYFAPTGRINSKRLFGANLKYAAGPLSVGVAYDKNTADMKTVGVYGSFDFGRVKVMSQFEKGDNYTSLTPAVTVLVPNEKIKAFSLGLTAPLGPILLRTGFLKIKSDLADRDATKFGFGGDYILSKRTNLYSDIGKWSGKRVLTAISPATTPATFNNANQKVQFDFGVTHRF
jgi:predicted porin